MQLDITVRDAPVTEVAGRAARCEELGFDSVSLTESTGNPFVAVAAATPVTSRVRLTTAVALALPRSPMDVAYAAWDLQALTGGRFALGLGTQVRAHIERRFSAVFDRPAARIREHVLALRAIWDCWEQGTPLAFEGEFYTHTLMPDPFRPRDHGHGRPPVLLAAVRERMLEVAGEVADGWIGHPLVTAEVLRDVMLPAVERGLERAGRDRASFEAVVALFVATDDEEWERVRRRVAFYGSTPAYRHVLDHHDRGDVFERLHAMTRADEWDAMPDVIDDELLSLFAVRAATPQEAAAELLRRADGVADRISLMVEGPSPEPLAPIVDAIHAHRG